MQCRKEEEKIIFYQKKRVALLVADSPPAFGDVFFLIFRLWYTSKNHGTGEIFVCADTILNNAVFMTIIVK